MIDNESELSQTSQLTLKIQNCLLKSLKSTQPLIDRQTSQNIRIKIEEITGTDSIIETIEYFLYALINQVEQCQQVQFGGDQEGDYENLEGAVQKAQAEIRKHIRLEQQLKIYMDGLEEKIQQLEKELKLEVQKYHQLFQSMRVIDTEKKELKKKVKEYEARLLEINEKDQRHLSHKTSKILSEPSMHEQASSHYKMYIQRNRIIKNKNYIDKSLHFRPIKQKKALQDDIEISLKHSPSTKKRNETQKTEIKQMTRTIQLQQNFRKQSRKLIKYSTEQRNGIGLKRGDGRCNSVCH